MDEPSLRKTQWYSLAIVIFAGDQAAKSYIDATTPLGWSHEVASFFNLVHALNPGAAFSFLAGAGGWQRWFFLAIDPFQGKNGWEAVSGSSFIYWVEMTPQGPRGKQIQVQGQSDDANSPLHADQTRRFSAGNYLDILFTEEEIQADPKLTVKTLNAKADGSF